MQKTKAKGMKRVLDCQMLRRILVGDFAFEIRNPKSEITSPCSMLAPSAKRLDPALYCIFLGYRVW